MREKRSSKSAAMCGLHRAEGRSFDHMCSELIAGANGLFFFMLIGSFHLGAERADVETALIRF